MSKPILPADINLFAMSLPRKMPIGAPNKNVVFGQDGNKDGAISKDELKTTDELKVFAGTDGILDRADLTANNLEVKDASNGWLGFNFHEDQTLSSVFEFIDFNTTTLHDLPTPGVIHFSDNPYGTDPLEMVIGDTVAIPNQADPPLDPDATVDSPGSEEVITPDATVDSPGSEEVITPDATVDSPGSEEVITPDATVDSPGSEEVITPDATVDNPGSEEVITPDATVDSPDSGAGGTQSRATDAQRQEWLNFMTENPDGDFTPTRLVANDTVVSDIPSSEDKSDPVPMETDSKDSKDKLPNF